MKKNNFNLLNLASRELVFKILSYFYNDHDKKPLKNIGGYSFVKKISDKKLGYSLDLYKDSAGKKYIVKKYTKKIKNFDYYSLKNEYSFYKLIINKVSNTHRITTPRDIDFIEINESIYLFVEYIEKSKILDLQSKTKKLQVFSDVVLFFDNINRKLTKKDIKSIPKRNGVSYLATFPIQMILALINNFKNMDLVILILKSSLKFVRSIFVLISSDKLTLVHRDLNFQNILLSKNKTYIIDFQMSLYTYKVCEYVNSLRYIFSSEKNPDFFTKAFEKTVEKDSEMNKLYQPMIIYFAIAGLGSQNFSKKIMKSFVKFLEYGLKYD